MRTSVRGQGHEPSLRICIWIELLAKTTRWIKFWRQAVGWIQASPPTVWRQPSNCPAAWRERERGWGWFGGRPVEGEELGGGICSEQNFWQWNGFFIWISWKGGNWTLGGDWAFGIQILWKWSSIDFLCYLTFCNWSGITPIYFAFIITFLFFALSKE